MISNFLLFSTANPLFLRISATVTTVAMAANFVQGSQHVKTPSIYQESIIYRYIDIDIPMYIIICVHVYTHTGTHT